MQTKDPPDLLLGSFLFRRTVETTRAHYQISIIDSDRNRAVGTVAPIISRDVSQRILIVELVRNELECVTGVFDGFSLERQTAGLGGQCAQEIRRDQVTITNRLLALAVDA